MYTFTVDGRRALLDIILKEVKFDDDCDLDEIAQLMEGYSGADIQTFAGSEMIMELSL